MLRIEFDYLGMIILRQATRIIRNEAGGENGGETKRKMEMKYWNSRRSKIGSDGR